MASPLHEIPQTPPGSSSDSGGGGTPTHRSHVPPIAIPRDGATGFDERPHPPIRKDRWYLKNRWMRRSLNVLLRVPALLLFETLYYFNWEKVAHVFEFTSDPAANATTAHDQHHYFQPNFTRNYLEWNIHIFGYLLAGLLLLLPLDTLVELYRLLVTGICTVVAHLVSWRFVSDEINSAVESGETHGEVVGLKSTQELLMTLFKSPTDLNLSPSIEHDTFQYLAIQCILAIACSTMMDTKNVLRFCPYTLPFLARLCNFPALSLYGFHLVSATLAAMQVFHVLLHNIHKPYHMAVNAYRWGYGAVRMYGYLPLLLSVFEWLSVPTIFLIFWLTMFMGQIHQNISTIATMNNIRNLSKERWIVVVLSAIAECCGSPVSVLGLGSTISYISFMLYKATRLAVRSGDRSSSNQDSSNFYGWTEGIMLVLLCLQTEIIQVKPNQRIFIITIILFIILSSTLQSMYEIVEPVLLSLSATSNASIHKHARVFALCLGLFASPIFLTYHVVRYFETDFWLLIIISSCLMTSVQVLGSILIYGLFLYDGRRSTPLESLDDAVYHINAMGKFFEYVIALSIVFYGTYESLFGHWSWIGTMVIVLHFYYGVYERGRLAWAAFLQRREAVRKIQHMATVDEAELKMRQDSCAICLNVLVEANTCVETPCKHCFHASCLRKWLYMQLTCPLCQADLILPITLSGTGGTDGLGSGGGTGGGGGGSGPGSKEWSRQNSTSSNANTHTGLKSRGNQTPIVTSDTPALAQPS